MRAAGLIFARRMGNFILVLAALLVLWQASSAGFDIPRYLLPTPSQIGAALIGAAAPIGGASLFTLLCTMAGLLVSAVLALTIATLFILSDRLDRALMPLIILARTVPVIAIAPLLIMIFGRGQWNSIMVVALLSFFQIMLAAKRGLRSPSANACELMRVYGASFGQTLIKLRLPAALPFLFTGFRIAAGSAFLCAMFAEWLSGAPGLGTLTLDAYSRQDFALMWAAVFSSTVAAYFFFSLTVAAEVMVAERRR